MKTHKVGVFYVSEAGLILLVAYTSTFYTIVSLLFYMGYFKKKQIFHAVWKKGGGLFLKRLFWVVGYGGFLLWIDAAICCSKVSKKKK
jgi:hypothetical protein